MLPRDADTAHAIKFPNAFGAPVVALSTAVTASPGPTALTVRTVSDSDWPAISLVSSTSFGAFSHPDTLTAWRTMMPNDSAVVVCDGADVVGVSLYLDFQLTAPGGTLLPAAGVSMVAVAPTHRLPWLDAHNVDRAAPAHRCRQVSDCRADSQRRRYLRPVRIRPGDHQA
ncbi:hypothetical protein MHAE_18202 [Mycobacterium haemophilum DSM 44634]